MRINGRAILAAAVLCVVWLAGALWSAGAQEAEVLSPDQSAAKAKQVLQQAVEALGGSAYRNFRDVTCTGRLGQFDHSGELTGYEKFIDYAEPPYKDRDENLPQRNIIQVFSGDKGWVLDRGGVSDAPKSDLAEFQDGIKKDMDNILLHRVQEPDMTFRYGGLDVVDLKEAEWVELIDSDNRTIRIAFVRATHLPLRKVVVSRDPATRSETGEIEYFSNYHPMEGVQTPFQITRERNGMKVFQAFFEGCQYNTGLSDSLFTKESLDERWAKVGKKEIEKEKKKRKKGEN